MTVYSGDWGNNFWTLTSADGSSSVDGKGGTDRLTVDWSDLTGQQSGLWDGRWRGNLLNDEAGISIGFREIEKMIVKLGGGNDTFELYSHGIFTGDFNGGAGVDTFIGHFGASRIDISFTLDHTDGATSTFVGQGTTISQFERVWLRGGQGDDSLTGGDYDDTLLGGSGRNMLAGGAGSDYLGGGYLEDTLHGGAGHDRLYGGDGGDDLKGDAGNDTLEGGDESDTLGGGEGDDHLLGGSGGDKLYGGLQGSDHLDGGSGADYMNGGTGDDVYVIDNVNDVVVEWADKGRDEIQTTLRTYVLATNFEDLTGLVSKGQVLTGHDFANSIKGAEGDDTLYGEGGDDTLGGGDGIDHLFGGAGNDDLYGGASGDDLLVGGLGADRMFGGSGNDTYLVDSHSDQVTEWAQGGHDTVITSLDSYELGWSVEDLKGESTTGQRLTGNDAANLITAGSGDDALAGLAGDDVLFGTEGDDSLSGGNGSDSLDGGSGEDVLQGDGGRDVLDGGLGNDRMVGGTGDDTFVVNERGDDVVEAFGGGSDTTETGLKWYALPQQVETLLGTSDAGQHLQGNDGDNEIVGGEGADVLKGGHGADRLVGGGGEDIIHGGGGADHLIGGADADAFVFTTWELGRSASSADIIEDFSRTENDIIDLMNIDADISRSGKQAFDFIATSAFSGTAGELRCERAGRMTQVEMDLDGDANADCFVLLEGNLAIYETDFAL
ncbi:calcium-binding protein [Palleronia sp.]|uniref:calcium-binding protein n=1 Tax=Palleronia sp. TaxID=1940284 RepID=UPI0035C857E8